MRRMRFQRGSLTRRWRNGKYFWYAQWRENGHPKSKELGTCSRMTKSEAESVLAEILRPLNRGSISAQVHTMITFGPFIESVYFPVCRGRRWKRSTGMTAEGTIRAHLIQPLGSMPVREIRRERLQQLLDSKAEGRSVSVINHLRFHLKAIFRLAMSEGIVNNNPAEALYTPKSCKRGQEKRVLSPEEADRLIRALELREAVIARLAIGSGLRPGEILGLQVGDIGESSVSIRRRVYKGDVDSPKTKLSEREAGLPPETVAALRCWIDTLPSRRPEAWVFSSENPKTPVWLDNIWRRKMKPRLEKIGLQWATFQVMRRTWDTLARRSGIDAHTRAAQLGHTVDVTENEYSITSLEDKVAAVRRVETVIQ